MNDKMQLIHERNKLVIKLLWSSLALAIVSDIANKAPAGVLITVSVVGGISVGLTTFFTYKRKLESKVKYIVLIGLTLLAYLIVEQNPYIGHYMILYYCLAVITVYHDYKLIILSGIVNLALTTYFFFEYRLTMFPGLKANQLVTLDLFLVLTVFVLVFQCKIGADMRKKLEESNAESEEKSEK